VGYTTNPEEALAVFVVSPTFMLGIWHGANWMKEIFGSAQSRVGWFMEVPDLVGLCIH